MATKKILIQVILDDKASASNKKIGNALGKTTGEFKKMTVEQEKQYIAQQKAIISNKLYTDSLKKQAIKQVDVAEATGNARAQSGLNNAILLETGRLASDASYGFTAMANNLGQIVSLFGSFIETNDGVVASFKQLLKSLWGIGGLLIGIQLLIAFGPKIYDFFTGMTEEMKKAAKAQEELNKSLDDLGNKIFQAQKYADVIENVNTSEEVRLNLTNELINQIPNLTAEDFKYGQNLDEVREKINEYALSQATRIEIDRLVEVNSEILSDAATVRRISEIKDEEEKTKAMKKFLEQQGMDVDARIRERKASAKEFIGTDAETIAAEFSLMTTEAILASRIIEEELNELYKNIKRQGDVGKKSVVELLETFRFGLETNELYLQGYTAQQIMAMEALDEGLRERNKRFDDLDRKNKKRQKALTLAEKTETQARLKIRESYFNSLDSLSKGLSALGSIDDNFKIAAIITEKASAIAKVILKTKETNQVISAAAKARSMLGDVTAIPTGRARRLSNNISAGVNIAGIVAAAAGGINAIKSKSSMSTSVSAAGEGGDGAEVQAPDFNVVGQGVGSQLAGAVNNQFGGALRAYVVSGDISSAQELDRKINTTATIG